MSRAEAITADELLRMRAPERRLELVRGELIVQEPPGLRHGRIAADLAYHLTDHVKKNQLGRVYAAETGFCLSREPDTVRAPDVAFISTARLPTPEPEGYAELAPDLVAEVVSASDRPGGVLAKIADWLDAGARLVWVVDDRGRSVRVYRSDGSESILGDDERLDGEDVVPGFSLPLRTLFEI